MQKRRLPLLVILLVLITSLALPALAIGKNGNPEATSRKIIVFRELANSQNVRDQILESVGAVKVKDLAVINAAVVLTGAASEKALRQRPEVVRVDPDIRVYTMAKPESSAKPPKTPAPPPAEVLPWGIDRIDADLVWDIDGDLSLDIGANTGYGVKVAVLDTGIHLDHPDLKANIKGGVNTINPRKSPDDDNGHGTHVAGTIAAVDNNEGVLGAAPQAGLYAVKVLDRNGSGYISDIIEGLQWSMANGMQVVNMSFGSSSHVQSLHDALISAHNSGIVLVAAAGNSGPGNNTVNYPARYPEVIAVSAIDEFNEITNWSSRGLEVELAAPGNNIYSTSKGASYVTLSGTSMAAPHVSGTAALVIATGIADQNDNGLINDELRNRLQVTANDLGLLGRDGLYGYGLVNAAQASK